MMSRRIFSSWEESTQEATRQVFEDMAFYSSDMKVHLKHCDGRFGSIPLEKALHSELLIELESGKDSVFYASVEAMIKDGWVVD